MTVSICSLGSPPMSWPLLKARSHQVKIATTLFQAGFWLENWYGWKMLNQCNPTAFYQSEASVKSVGCKFKVTWSVFNSSYALLGPLLKVRCSVLDPRVNPWWVHKWAPPRWVFKQAPWWVLTWAPGCSF